MGWSGRPIYFAAVLTFLQELMDESEHQVPTDTIPTLGPPALLIKYPLTFHPCCLPCFTGGNEPNFYSSRLWTAVFLNWGALSENKTNVSRIDDRSTTIPNLGWVGPPTPKTVNAMGTPKDKTGKFLICPPFQRPTPSTAPPMLDHLLGP